MTEAWKRIDNPTRVLNGNLAVANAHKEKVKVTFAQKARLADPVNLFNAGLNGNQRWALDLSAGDKLDKPALVAMIRRAIAYNSQK